MSVIERVFSAFRRVPGTVVVVGVAAIVTAVVSVAKYEQISYVDAEVLDGMSREPGRASARSHAPIAHGVAYDLPIVKTVDRVGELHALTAILALEAIHSQRPGGRPAGDVGQLVGAVAARGTVPPGISVEAAGVLRSASSRYYVRFRPRPIGVEVVSVGLDQEGGDGAPLLERITAERGAEVFSGLRERAPVPVPPPFVSPSEVVAAGWMQETLRDGDPAAWAAFARTLPAKEVR